MSKVDASSHVEEELSDWMSQLFEKLDMEVYEDDACSSGKVAEVGAYPNVDSSEIYRSGNDSAMFEKLNLKLNEDNICSTGKVAQEEAHPIQEGGISSEVYRSLRSLNFCRFFNKDEFQDWMTRMVKLGDCYECDVCSVPEVDQEKEDLIHCDVPDGNMKKNSYKETIENGFRWMSEECFLAFTKSVANSKFEGIEYKFGELLSQCLNIESYHKIFHHYNFTIEEKHGSSDVWTSKLYFAEVKQMFGVKIYLCCLLEPNDNGHCYGCQNQDMYELKHPIRDDYEEGDAGICWPFMDDPEYVPDSDDDSEIGY